MCLHVRVCVLLKQGQGFLVYPRMTLNLISLPPSPKHGISGLCHHAWSIYYTHEYSDQALVAHYPEFVHSHTHTSLIFHPWNLLLCSLPQELTLTPICLFRQESENIRDSSLSSRAHVQTNRKPTLSTAWLPLLLFFCYSQSQSPHTTTALLMALTCSSLMLWSSCNPSSTCRLWDIFKTEV